VPDSSLDSVVLLSRHSLQRERLSASMVSICLFVCLSVCLSVCLFVYLSSKCKKNVIFSKLWLWSLSTTMSINETMCRIPIWWTFERIQWHAIPKPPATLQGAATWRIQCHDSRATCHIAGCSHLAKSMS